MFLIMYCFIFLLSVTVSWSCFSFLYCFILLFCCFCFPILFLISVANSIFLLYLFPYHASHRCSLFLSTDCVFPLILFSLLFTVHCFFFLIVLLIPWIFIISDNWHSLLCPYLCYVFFCIAYSWLLLFFTTNVLFPIPILDTNPIPVFPIFVSY